MSEWLLGGPVVITATDDGASWVMFLLAFCACFWLGLTVGFVIGEWRKWR